MLIRSLVEVVGAAHVQEGAACAGFAIDGRAPRAAVFPASPDEVAGVMRVAAAARVPVVPWGGGTDMHVGAPPPAGALVVGTRRLTAVLEHEPGDLTATVEAGLTMEALQAALGPRGQWLPLDPPAPARSTLGGVLATNRAGPRRQLYGTARDLVLGLRVVTADGELVRAGGRVVKNVAGYDLAKLYLGSRGTLGIIVEATVKLRPRPEAEAACWGSFATLADAARAAAALAGGELGPTALELLDGGGAAVAGRAAAVPVPAEPAVLVTFDGLGTTVAWQQAAAARELGAAGASAVARLDAPATRRALEAVREIRTLIPGMVAVARAGVLPSDLVAYLGEVAAAAAEAGLGLAVAAHAGQGLATLAFASDHPAVDATAGALARCRAAARARGGHLALEAAPIGVREACPTWDPPGPAGELMRAVKARLDPAGLLNPGRFVGGI